MLLTGTAQRTVDDKQRIALPKRFRDALAEEAEQGLFVTPGTDGSLAIYTQKGLERVAQRLESASPTAKDTRAFSRLFYAQAEPLELDAQGRVRIPQNLAELAKLGKDVMVMGVQDHLEIWDSGRWAAYFAEKSKSYDELAESAFVVRE